ncbi:MAG: peptidase prepilin type [Bryobacterales bacterium]|jgi:prepilin peptidase CpaA|nr:peptidase prepilin type [Bryobacterales bacterium]
MPPVTQVLLMLLVLPAAVFDYRERRIPNWLVLAGLLAGTAMNVFLTYDNPSATTGLLFSLKGLGLAFLVYFPLYLLRGMGAGDVKLMAAVGAIVGPALWLWILFFTAVLGGLTAIIVVLNKGRVRRTLQNLWMILISIRYRQAPYANNPELDVSSDKGVRLPHGVVIAVGATGFLVAKAIWP